MMGLGLRTEPSLRYCLMVIEHIFDCKYIHKGLECMLRGLFFLDEVHDWKGFGAHWLRIQT